MNRYINVDAIEYHEIYDGQEFVRVAYGDDIDNIPTADVVEVVPCKDCCYGHRFFDVINGIPDSWVECRNPDGLNRDTSEDSFCSCAERRNDE